MSGTASYLTRFSVASGASPTFDSSTLRWDANTLDPGHSQEILERQGLRGTRLAHVVDTRLGNYTVRPTFMLNPSPKFLGQFLVFAMGGGTETAPAFADTLPEFGMLIDHNLDVYKILGCKVDTLSLRFQAGQLVECGVACVGKTIADDQTFAGAALGTTLAYEPYQAADITFTYDSGSDTPVLLDGELTINNGLAARMALGDLAANEVFPAIRRQTRFTGRAAFESEALALRDDHAGAGASSGAVASLSLVNSTVSTVFAFSNMQLVPKYTVVEGTEIIVPIQAEVRATGAGTAEMTVTNDVTP
jgi:hypothetical protein